MRSTPRIGLADLTPKQQLTAGRTLRRSVQLFVGLTLYGFAMAMLVRAGLGLDPWDVLHYGIAERTGLSLGTVVVLVSLPVLALWIPLRQWPGLGTIANAFWVGVATDVGLRIVPTPEAMPERVAMLLAGVVINALAGALYIGSQFGPGPRDGLMTGLHRRTGLSIRLIRTSLEISVLAIGWLLGGIVGIGTVVYALAIGPLVQFFLPRVIVSLPSPSRESTAQPQPAPEVVADCS